MKVIIKKKNNKFCFYQSNSGFYKISLKNSSERLRNDIFFFKNSIKTINLNFLINKIYKMYFDIKLEIEVLKFDYNQLKNICLELDKKMNHNIKRKIMNLLTEKIFDKYFDNINTIEKSQSLICLSINELKKEIKKLEPLDDIDLKKQNHKEELEKKLKAALLLLKEKTKSDINDINNKTITFEENNNILFINKTNDKKEIFKVVLLNIFFLLKKRMKDKYNNSIHNETKGINEIIKDEETKIKKEEKLKTKDNKKKEKIENDEYILKNNREILCQKNLVLLKILKELKYILLLKMK